jgi:hypothetical protein
MSSDIEKGTVTLDGTATAVNIGFTPKRIDIFCSKQGLSGYWEDSMRDGTMVIEDVRELESDDILIGRHLPFIGSTDTQLANRRVVCLFNAAGQTFVEKAATAAGTAFTGGGAHDVATASKWACFQLCVVTGGTISIEPSSALNYATEALAIAGMGTKTADSASLGYITIQSTAGAIWDATTDSLEGGTNGTAAAATNYYEGYGIMANGITSKGQTAGDTYRGFQIGTNALVNFANGIVDYKAYRS